VPQVTFEIYSEMVVEEPSTKLGTTITFETMKRAIIMAVLVFIMLGFLIFQV
jgi:hypothetical protein